MRKAITQRRTNCRACCFRETGLRNDLNSGSASCMISTGGSFLSVWRMVPFVTTILPNSAERREPPRPHTSQKSATSKLLLTPELSVAASAPVVAPPQPQSPTLRKLGLGPRGARPAIKMPPAGSLPAPAPRPGSASPLLTPVLSVTAPAPVVAPPQPQSPTLRKLGLGPRGARPAIKTPLAGSPAPSPALPLTPEQQARLAAMPVASRDQVLLWLATGDPILVAEARKKLAPLRPCPEAPRTLPELLGRIREDPSYPALAASALAAALQDQKSYSGYLRRCEEAWRGELNPDRLLSAYDQAMGPKARNRGAIFMVAVRQKE